MSIVKNILKHCVAYTKTLHILDLLTQSETYIVKLFEDCAILKQ